MTAEPLHPAVAAASLPRRHPLDMIVDRPRRQAALAVAATWLAFMAGMIVEGEVADPISFVIAGASGAALVWLGFAAVSRCRTLPAGGSARRVRLALLTLAVGVGLGLANLAVNGAMAAASPTLRVLMAHRFVSVPLLDAVFVAPVVEEILVRLFLLSAIAWAVFRLTHRPGLAFAVALISSAFFFSLLHLDRPMPADAVLANLYRAALLAKYMVVALPLGWMFWRWGLPYAMLCHAVVNATHLLLQGVFF